MTVKRKLLNIANRAECLHKWYVLEYDSNEFAGEMTTLERINGHLGCILFYTEELRNLRKIKKEKKSLLTYIHGTQ